ncbi:hypothetical protein VTO42DRAFT_4138 [Malbranchea cinnamomea]
MTEAAGHPETRDASCLASAWGCWSTPSLFSWWGVAAQLMRTAQALPTPGTYDLRTEWMSGGTIRGRVVYGVRRSLGCHADALSLVSGVIVLPKKKKKNKRRGKREAKIHHLPFCRRQASRAAGLRSLSLCPPLFFFFFFFSCFIFPSSPCSLAIIAILQSRTETPSYLLATPAHDEEGPARWQNMY